PRQSHRHPVRLHPRGLLRDRRRGDRGREQTGEGCVLRPGTMRLKAAFAGMAIILAAIMPALAAERITSFDATIEVMPSSDIVVEEKIDVVSEGRQIKHGIFRTIPLRYQDEYGNRRSATIDVLGVSLDGRAEPYQVERTGNGVRI